MARPKSTANMTIAQLESILNERKDHLNSLMGERKKLQMQLTAVDREVAVLSGTGGSSGSSGSFAGTRGGTSTQSSAVKTNGRRRGGRRAKNSMSLVAMLEKVLADSGQPMSVGDILEAVQKGGYRSTSANFRGLINQTLIKDKRFRSASRGMYEMRK